MVCREHCKIPDTLYGDYLYVHGISTQFSPKTFTRCYDSMF